MAYQTVRTSVLEIAYEERGPSDGIPTLLLHGFPDDIRVWDAVTAKISKLGFRTITPYLRGYGPTRFLSAQTPRSGQQAALGQDVIDFADALGLKQFILVGYDWGGRAAVIASVLQPQRVLKLVIACTSNYAIYKNQPPQSPYDYTRLSAYWYQWFLNLEMGRSALAADRRGFCRALWQTWSPGWKFKEKIFETTAASWDNPDFVDVVVHSYRHRLGNAPGDPRYAAVEKKLIQSPDVTVPALFLPGEKDGVDLLGPPVGKEKFTAGYSRKIVKEAGHFVPREKPDAIINELRKLAL